MAVFTVTASDATAFVRSNETNTTVVRTHLGGSQLPASFSASDIVLIARIPNKATILDFYMAGIVPSDATIFKVGTAADDDAVAATFTLSATAQIRRLGSTIGTDGAASTMPFKVSLSDDVNPQWTYLFATRVSGTATITCSIQFVVTYAMPGAV